MYKDYLDEVRCSKSLQERIAENLTFLRHSRNLSQESLARTISISRSKYNRIEKGRICPDIITLCDLLVFYDISLEQFLNMSIAFDPTPRSLSEEQVDKSDCSRHCGDRHDSA